MKVAALDLGTNSFLCYIAESVEGKGLSEVFDDSKIIRLGEGVSKTGRISAEALVRAKECLEYFSGKMGEFGVERIRATATSAARDAENADDFVKIVKDLGIPIDIISGEEEARLTFLGATADMEDIKECLVVDSGGGSTEFTFTHDGKKVDFLSLNLGAVRLKDRFDIQDKFSDEQVDEISKFVRSELKNIRFDGLKKLVGVGGTITTLSCVLNEKEFNKSFVNHSVLTKVDLDKAIELFASKTLEERKNLVGLSPRRADIIIYGTIILREVLEHLQAEEIMVSTSGVRVGVALELA